MPLVSEEPVLLTTTEFRRIMQGQADDAEEADLRLFLQATDEVVAGIVGPLVEPIPSRWRLAARIIAEHLWDHWQGAVPTNYQGGSDLEVSASGFAVPRAALELLKQDRVISGPLYSFPLPNPWPA